MVDIAQLGLQLGQALTRKSWRLALAESCTGGGIASAVTDIAGSSAWFDRGAVTYCNQAKHEMLGVDMQDLLEYGAVSEVVAKAMAMGILAKSQAQIALSVTGVAGPGGGTPSLPVGTVWFAVAREGQVQAYHQYFSGGRVEVRQAAVAFALSQLTVIVSQS